ncbi:S-adenosyl-L-methionine-dependent methyltransferase [Geopyxis carbonaria]|nr:S-adenosyl-L-methionine-dependent methyltransferase [Geopyxis carbonaria]
MSARPLLLRSLRAPSCARYNSTAIPSAAPPSIETPSTEPSTSAPSFLPGDPIILRHVKNPHKSIFTTLTPSKTTHTNMGTFSHDAILSLGPRGLLTTSSHIQLRVTHPTLAEYLTRTRRLVTPVYPLDAAAIAALLDLHPGTTVLEAGSGHGSLTLALARSGATVHSLDIAPAHSAAAAAVVAGFRRGLYAPRVHFDVSEPTPWLDAREPAWLDAVLLDMPAPEAHFAAALRALRPDGVLAVWCPSVTQIVKCVAALRSGADAVMERVVEFPGGTGEGAGLRRWDVRPAMVRARQGRKVSVAEAEMREGVEVEEKGEEVAEEGTEMVCRPMAGEALVGGGFFAMWRRRAEGELEQVRRGTEREARVKAEKVALKANKEARRAWAIPGYA